MAMQPMGRGVGPSRFEQNQETAIQQANILEQQAVNKAAQFQDELLKSPMLALFVQEMEATLLRVYQEHPDGQAQIRLLKQLKIGIDPTAVIKNLRRKLMGASLSAIAETQAAP